MKDTLEKSVLGPECDDNEERSDRTISAVISRKNLVNDFFGGWEEDDLEILRRYQVSHSIKAEPGEIVDWLGIRTDIGLHAWLPRPATGILAIRDLPVPDDQVHAEAIEYMALIIGLERALDSGRQVYTAMELGASYAPWATAAGVLALRLGIENVDLVAVEASKESVPNILKHAARNGLADSGSVKFTPVHGAIYVRDECIFFPKIDVASDNGAQLSVEKTSVDYRGVDVEYDKVDGICLKTLCATRERIDFLHMDLQGTEELLLKDDEFLETLNDRVSTFFLATQSRLIEGIALKNLSRMGWVLIRERPTMFRQNSRTMDINGWTLRDGGQIWLNRKFGEKHTDL